jgi:hypothetical protein
VPNGVAEKDKATKNNVESGKVKATSQKETSSKS